MLSRKVWSTKDATLPLVVRDSSWRFIHDYKHIKGAVGVFLFANSAHSVKYAGHTTGKCVIETIAEAINEGKNANATMVKVLSTASDEDASVLCKVIKEKYAPENNLETDVENKLKTSSS